MSHFHRSSTKEARSTLGLVADTSSDVQLQSGAKYDHLFPKPENRSRMVYNSRNVDDTVRIMADVLKKYYSDTTALAPFLHGKDIYSTARNIYDFVFNHIKYENDAAGKEELRRPAVTWHQRKGDCDCMTIMIASILMNLGIEFKIRVAQYHGRSDYEHVYIIIPQGSGKNHITVDPVLRPYMFSKPSNVSMFNYEMPYEKIKDFTMSELGLPVHVLSGLGNTMPNNAAIMQQFIDGDFESPIDFLTTLRSVIQTDPKSISNIFPDPTSFLKMLDYLIQYYYSDRQKALTILEQNELIFKERNPKNNNNPAFSFFSLLKQILEADSQQSLSGWFSDAWDAVKTYNPLTLGVRAAFRLLIEMNYMGWATKFAVGRSALVDSSKTNQIYQSLSEIKSQQIDIPLYKQYVEAYKKTLDFYKSIGGTTDAELNMFYSVIRKGKFKGAAIGKYEYARKLRGVLKIIEDHIKSKYGAKALGNISEVRGLGEPVTLATAITIASTAIIAISKIFSSINEDKELAVKATATPSSPNQPGSSNPTTENPSDGSSDPFYPGSETDPIYPGSTPGNNTASSSNKSLLKKIGLPLGILGGIGLLAWGFIKGKNEANEVSGVPAKSQRSKRNAKKISAVKL